ncbi:unnamed protein product [Prorocentrum cordatum]|uniref:Uncharacterized protein n=1 Tax=Prorocentrum cordatum TaxID=2364126 RepID=A0ABN9QHQ4_9DINO|nr:unnamed protein product [Polarella glacialis]
MSVAGFMAPVWGPRLQYAGEAVRRAAVDLALARAAAGDEGAICVLGRLAAHRDPSLRDLAASALARLRAGAEDAASWPPPSAPQVQVQHPHDYRPCGSLLQAACDQCRAPVSTPGGPGHECRLCRRVVCASCTAAALCETRALLAAGRAGGGGGRTEPAEAARGQPGDETPEPLAALVTITPQGGGYLVDVQRAEGVGALLSPRAASGIAAHAEYGRGADAFALLELDDGSSLCMELVGGRLECMAGVGSTFHAYAALFRASGGERRETRGRPITIQQRVEVGRAGRRRVSDLAAWVHGTLMTNLLTYALADESSRAFLADLRRFVVRGPSAAPTATDGSQVGALEQCLSNPYEGVRIKALRALAGHAGESGQRVAALALSRLGDPVGAVRSAAIDTLVQSADGLGSGGAAARRALAACIGDADAQVGQAAAGALSRLVERGDPQVAAAVSAHTRHGDWRVRRLALQTLARVARPGCPAAASSVHARLDDDEWPVRQAALQALAELACRGDVDVVRAVCAGLEDGEADVRAAAQDALESVAARGDPFAIAEVAARLAHPEAAVRAAGAGALARVAARGDGRAVAEVAGCLRHGSPEVREGAAAALAQAARPGDRRALAALAACCEGDAEPRVRAEALRAMSQLGSDGAAGGLVVAAAAARLEDGSPQVRQAAQAALRHAATRDGERVVAAVGRLLEHGRGPVRDAAVGALAALAPENEDLAVDAVLARTTHGDSEIRQAAVDALPLVAAKASRRVAARLAADLEGAVGARKEAMLNALGRAATTGDDAVIAAVQACLGDSDWKVRRAAVGALGFVAGGAAVPAAAALLQDGRAEVRRAAARALTRLYDMGSEEGVVEPSPSSKPAPEPAAARALAGLWGMGSEEGVVEPTASSKCAL